MNGVVGTLFHNRKNKGTRLRRSHEKAEAMLKLLEYLGSQRSPSSKENCISFVCLNGENYMNYKARGVCSGHLRHWLSLIMFFKF